MHVCYNLYILLSKIKNIAEQTVNNATGNAKVDVYYGMVDPT